MPLQTYTVQDGWLMKKGRNTKKWRPRYCVLLSDGFFIYFKKRADRKQLNCFSVFGCQVIKNSEIRENLFIIRCVQRIAVVERTFAVESYLFSTSLLEEWISAIEEVAKPVQPKLTCDDFEMLKTLREGTFGKIMLGKYVIALFGKPRIRGKAREILTKKKSGNIYAIKLLRKVVILATDEVEHTLTENQVLQSAKHPFLAVLKYSFQTENRIFFYYGICKWWKSREEQFSESKTRFYGAEITLALKYLHEHKIVYRDLKVENIFIDSDGHIKITEFGLGKVEILFADTTKTLCESPEFLAPEEYLDGCWEDAYVHYEYSDDPRTVEVYSDIVAFTEDFYVLHKSDYGHAVDWWGLGVVLYDMLCGRLPFYNRDHKVLFHSIQNEQVRFPAKLSAQSKSILNGLLEKDPQKRLGGGVRDAEEVMAHKFFKLINWDDILHKKVPPPFKPTIEDLKYFDEDFTRETPKLTPPDDGLLEGDHSFPRSIL